MNIVVLTFGCSVYHMMVRNLKDSPEVEKGLEIDAKKRKWTFWGIEKGFGEINELSYRNTSAVVSVFDLDHPGDAQKMVDVVTAYYRDR